MNEDFAPFELAVKLKEKGFGELCLAYYTNNDTLYYNYSHKYGACYADCYLSHNLMPKDSVSGKFVDAPTISQVLKWLRKEKKINAGAVWDNRDSKWVGYINEMDMPDLVGEYALPNTYDTYEQAVIAVVNYYLDNLI